MSNKKQMIIDKGIVIGSRVLFLLNKYPVSLGTMLLISCMCASLNLMSLGFLVFVELLRLISSYFIIVAKSSFVKYNISDILHPVQNSKVYAIFNLDLFLVTVNFSSHWKVKNHFLEFSQAQ